MNTLVQNQGSAAALPPSDASPLLTVRLLLAIARFANCCPWIAFAVITAAFTAGYSHTLSSRHLDHDELFTYYIAQTPSVGTLLHLTQTIDLHPPLSYLLTRASFAAFGVSAWSCRLPFLLAYLLFTALVFRFASRLLSPIYAFAAILTLWISPYVHLATEARSYSMVLCFTALMVASWHEIIASDDAERSQWAYAALVAGGFGLLLSHVLGVLAYSCFLAAEGLRSILRRRSDWRLWLAMVAPLPSILAYLPLIHLRSEILFSPWSQASPRRLAICYWEHVRCLVVPWAFMALIAIVWPFVSKRRDSTYRSSSSATTLATHCLLFLLFLVPLEVAILFARTGTAFYERYGVVAMIPCAILPILFLGYRTRGDHRIGALVAILLATLLFLNTSGKPWLTEQLATIFPPRVGARLLYFVVLPPIAPAALALPSVPAGVEKDLSTASPVLHLGPLDPDIPFVAGTGPTFLELDRYEDVSLTHRLYLLTNREAASAIAHNTVFENYEVVRAAFPIRGNVQAYCDFLSKYRQFLVLGGYNYPDNWVLRKLEMDGANLRIVGTYDDGVVEEHQVYRVSIEHDPCSTRP